MECLSKILRLKRSGARQLELVSLEDRLLFSAAPGPAPEAPADNAQIETVIMASLEAPVEILSNGFETESDTVNAQGLQPLGWEVETSTATHELVFIDTGAANYQDLLDDLWTHQDPDRQIDVVLLTSGEDGIAQITETLAQYRTQKLDAVHLVTHGADRAIKLGNTWLDATALEQYRDQIASWGEALRPGADLLVYGCDLAGNDLGRALLSNLVDLTGADIAASIDDTGSSLLGGNWDLEYELGDIETDVAFSVLAQEEYEGLLAAFSVTTTADTGVGSLRQAIIDANALAGADTISFTTLGAGTHTISVASALPDITDSVVIDGWSALSYSSVDAIPDIIINGNSTTAADGLRVSGNNVTIRGLNIQRFDGAGIRLDSGTGAVIQGNWIGLNSTGTALAETAGAMADGIQIRSGSNTVGGTTLQTRNVIAGAQDGIRLRDNTATGNVIRGNIIGARPDMTGSFGNTDDGIDIGSGAHSNTIGGSNPGEGNIVVSSTGNGIELRSDAGVNNRLSRNSIFASGGLGIDDQSGAIARPSLSTATSSGGTTTISGSLNSAASTTYRIEFYATPSTLVDSGGGEGRLYLGSTNVTTNSSGAATISASLSVAVNHGDSVTAIAIGPTGETSHFAANIVLTGNTSELVVDTVRDIADASGFGSSLTVSSLLSSRGSDGAISLREAIDAANRTGGVNTIYFNLPGGGGQHTINLTSALPTITEGVHINASSDSDFAGTPIVELNGTSAGATTSGLRLSSAASNSSIRGLVINRFGANGILLDGADSVTIAGNFIGTDITGLIDLGNGEDGIQLQNNAVNNTIGGLTASDRNVVSGNNNAGIAIDGVGSSGNTLIGNYIGLGADGATSLGNTHDGVHLLGALNTVIGSSDPAGRNVISGNAINGIGIDTATGTIIRNNYIGSDSTGLLDRGNLSNGILMTGTVTGTTVGGVGVGNLISGNNAKGIYLDGAGVTGATIQGNRIGTDVNGTGNLGNGQSGIEAWNGSLNNLIGGATTSLGNIVAFNGGDGVLIRDNSTGNAILSNSIFGNVESGIDLGTTGVTNNDPGDGDIGANNQMNFPVIYSVAIVGGNVTITGEARLGATVQFFEAVGTDSNGEGQTLIGSGTVTGSTAGTVDSTARQFSFTFDVGSLVGGDRVTATATDGAGSTSEFSVNANVTSLIGHWKFDADANDFSGNGYNGTLTNGSLIDTAGGTNQIGAGKLSLDGVDDFVDLTVHRSHFASLSQGTIAAWVKTSDSLGTIFELDDTADVDSYASFYTSGGKLIFEVYENNSRIFGVRSTVDINDNAWHHVAVTVDAGGNKLFIDGVQASVTYSTGSASSGTFFSSVSGVDTMQIGVSQNNAGLRDRMVGLIDDVRVYNGALTTSEIAALAANTTYTISGTIYEDVDGDGQVSDDGVGLASAIVSLYRDDGDGVLDAGDTIVNSILANGSGQYTFTGLSNDTYWVVADSRSFIGTGGLNGGYTIHDQWAEQTYGSTGSVGWNGSAYTFTGTAGAFFGGLRADRGDNGASLLTAEHVTRVAVASANVASVDYGFSYNVITNTRDGDEVAANNRTIQGSLRQFIQNSNALATTHSSNFQIGSGAQTISLTSILDNISDRVVLDATTQEGFSGTPLIVLDGNVAAGDGFHLTASADSSTIRGFVIRDFAGDAIEIVAGSDGHTIAGNYLGALTTSGTDAGVGEQNGESGLAISGANNTIGGATAADRNVISGNNLEGIVISGTGATGNLIVGNYIGTSATGAGDLGNSQDGILLDGGASGNTIGGVNLADRNVISGNDDGIAITGSTTSLNVIQGNYIGLGSDGATAIGNDFDGIHISQGAHDNTIGGSISGARNVISASGANGIQIEGTGTDNNVVQGNLIGTDATGELDRGNASDGVRIGNGAQSNTIGGTAPEARNIISGNDGDGVDIQGTGTTGNVVQGNYIGTDDDGEQALGNSSEGVDVSASGNTIGGSVAGAGNVISGNNLRGVYVTGAGVSATIQGNYVGTDKDGLQALGNSFDGIEVNFGAGAVSIRDNLVAANGQWGINLSGTGAGNTVDGNTVGLNVAQNGVLGGTGIGASSDGHTITGNTIGGSSSYGIYLTGSANNTIQGNYIGTNSTGATGLGNAWQGIGIDGANSDFNLIGGTDSGEGNVIAHNTRDGISIASGAGTGISMLGNTFRSNGGLAIDLSDNGVTSNDNSGNPSDQDTGPNGLQNFPVLSSVRVSGTDLIIEGELRTDGVSTSYRLEFYGNPVGTADATNGEGRIYLGSTLVTTDADGRVSFSVTLFAAGLTPGDSVTGTATRVDALAQVGVNDQLAYGSTSEFATNMTVLTANSAPTLVAATILNSIQEDPTSNTGTLVSKLVDTEATDPDVGALKGIAITTAPTTNGNWEYTLNGTTWLSMGTPSTVAALLLPADATTAIRFVPNTNFNGVSGLLSYKAWDQTSGTAGGTADVTSSGASTAFSLETNGTSVSVSAVNDQPMLTSLDGAPTHVEGGASVFLDTNVSVFDVELSALDDFDGATLTLNRQGGANPEDQLAFDGLTVTVSGTDLFVSGVQIGTYSFTGGTMSIAFGTGATNVQVNTVLQNIVYWNSSDNPPTSVQLDWVFSDGNSGTQGTGGALQATGSSTVNITPANDAPSITLMNVGGPYVEGGTPALFDSAPILSDPDSANFDTGTLTASIVSAGTADDRITIRHQGAAAGQIGVSGNDVTYGGTVIGTWTGGTSGSTPLVITFNSQATLAAVQALAGNIQFSNVSDNPSTTSRLIRMVVTDGDGGTSNNGQNLLAVTAVNDSATISLDPNNSGGGANDDGFAVSFGEGAGPIVVVDTDATINDFGEGDIETLALSLSGFVDGAAEKVTVAGVTFTFGTSASQSVIVGSTTFSLSYNSGFSVISITRQGGGNMPAGDLITVLQGVAYQNTSANPTAGDRTISFFTNEPGNVTTDSATATISVTTSNNAPVISTNTLSISEGGTVVLSTSHIHSSDPDNTTAQLTYTASSITGGRFELVASPGTAITSFTQAQINAGAVQFVHNGSEAAPSYQLTVSDGSLTDGPHAVTIGTYTPVNDAPIATGETYTISEDGTLTVPIPGVLANDTDAEGTPLSAAAVTLPSHAATFNFTTSGNIVYQPVANFVGTDSFTYLVTDGTLSSNTVTVTIQVTATNDAPSIVTNTLSISEGGTVVLSSAEINTSDPDAVPAGLTYSISNLSGGQFELVASPGAAITSFTQAQINAGAVQFVHDGNEAVPSYQLTVSDGSLSHGPSSVAISSFTNTNDAPVISFGQGNITHVEGNSVSTIDNAVSVTDLDSADFAGGTLTVTVSGGDTSDQLLVQHQGTGVGQVSVSGFNLLYNSGLGSVPVGTWSGGAGSPLVITFSSSATAAEVEAVSKAVGFQNLSSNPSPADRTVQYQLTDGDGGTSAAVSKTVHFTTVNTGPSATGPAAVTTDVDTEVTFSSTNANAISINDPDSGLNSIEVRLSVSTGTITLANTAGLVLSVGTGVADQTLTMTGTVAAIRTAIEGLRYTPQTGYSGTDRLMIEVNDLGNTGIAGTALTASHSVNIYIGTVPFLRGDYLELGFNGSGSLGSTLGAPAGYQSSGSSLAAESDPERDGGTYDGDFILPGSPEEGWGVHVGGTTYSNNTTNWGTNPISGNWGVVTDTGTAQSMTWTGAVGGVDISAQHTVLREGLYLEIVVTLTNTTTSTLGDIYYYRNVDPDNNYDQSSTYDTTNTILSQGNDGSERSVVTATQPDGSFISLTGYGENSRVTYGGFSNRDPLAIYNGTGLFQSGSAYNDEAISLAFHVPTLAAGQSTTLMLRYTFGNEAAPDVDLDGDNSAASGLDHHGMFVEDGGPVAIVDSDMTLFDADNDLLQGMTITLTNPLDGVLESLSATTTGTNITASYDSGTGVLTLLGQDTLASYRHVLSSVVYDNSSNTPNTISRVITIAVSDGTHTSPIATSTIDVLATNDPPVLLTNTLTISEGGTVVLSSADINASDPESPSTGLTFTVSTLSGGHFENVASGATITSFTQDQVDNGGIRFVHDGGEAAPAYSLTLSDGAQSVGPSAAMISFTNENDAPVTGAASASANEDVSPILVVLGGVDVDGTITQIRVATLPANGVLYLNAAMTNPVVSGTDYATTAGQLSVYFAPTPNWNGSTSFTFAAIDNLGAIDATPATATINVTEVNDIPVVTLSAVPIEFTENNPVGLMVDLVVTDVDSATLTSATISITSNFVAGEDQLVFTDMLGITGNYNAVTGVLSLSGTASLADYQTALRSIAYFNPSENPTSAARQFQVVVSDGSSPSVAVTRSININAVNDAPTISSISNQTINEDTVLGPLAFTVNDNDSSNLVVTAATSDGTLIPLSNIVLNGTGTNRTITVTPSADLYGGPVTITLTVSDGSLTAQTSFDVTVQPVNDAPTVNSATFAVSETANNGTLVGTVVAGDVDLGDTRSFSVVSGDPLGAFAIDGAGQITVADASQLDFETRPTWTLTVQVRDAAGATATSTITVNLIDQNDNSPIIVTNGGGSSASISVAENTTSVTTVQATDADAGTTVQYSLSGVDSGLFQIDINTGVLTFLAAPDFERPADANGDNAYEITVIASDGTRTDTQVLTVTVTEVNESSTTPIVDFNGTSDTIAENAAVGSLVGVTAFADDLDATDTVSYSLLNDASGRFAIDSVTGVVTVAGALDYESSTSHTIRVQALSTDGTSTVRDFTIAVTDANEFATTAISDLNPASETLAEDLAVGSSVGVTAFADDLDGTDTVSYSLLNDAGGRFAIDSVTGVVTLAQALNYETSISHMIQIEARSTDGSSSLRDFTFVITDLNEFATTAVVDNDVAVNSVAENATVGSAVGMTAFADDLDGTDTVSYSLLDSASGRFSIDTTTGIVTVASALDYETSTSHTIRVQALSTDGSSTFRDFTISVTEINEYSTTPISDVNGAVNAVAENSAVGTFVGVTAFADDLDRSDTVTYSLDSDAGGLVAIDSVTGVVTVNSAIDFETTSQLSFIVRATSTDSSSSTQLVTVDVLDRNDTAPIVSGGQIFTVAENTLNGTSVGTVLASDVDTVGGLQNWQIVGGTGAGAFSINAVTGEITVADSVRFNFEATPALTLQVTVSDGIQNSAVQTVTILLSDVNERPTLVGGSFTLAENAALGTVVGSLSASDVDAGDSLSYSIIGGNSGGTFSVNATTGEITVLDSSALDFETTRSFTLTIQVTDQGGLTHQQAITISLLDLNERPTLSDGTYHVPEWSGLGASVGLVSASDVDMGDSLTFRILSGNTGGRFLIDSNTGEIRVANPVGFTHESQSSFTLTVEVEDLGGLTHSALMTVIVDNVNLPPIALNDFYSLVQFEPLITTSLKGVLLNDGDSDSQSLTLTLISGPANGTLTLNPDGSFTYSSNDLFAGVDTFTYQLSDGFETSQVATVSLTVGLVGPGEGGNSNGNGGNASGSDNGSTDETDTDNESVDVPGGGSSTATTTAPPLKVATPPRVSVDSGTPTHMETPTNEFIVSPLDPMLGMTTSSTIRSIVRAIERPIASAIFPDLTVVRELVPEPMQDLTMSILENQVMWNQLNSFRDDVNSRRESTTLMENIVVGTTTAVSGGLTVGYVIWLIRGGSLLATMMSVMPTWISFDPLPVMDQFEEDDLIEDEESLASIVTGRR